jgi:uncharacterized protein DUF6933
MVTLRCTQKLLRRVGIAAKTNTMPPTTVLGDWYANIVYSRPQQLVVCMNERSLLLVLLPARDAKNIGSRLRASVISLLTRIGTPAATCDAEAQAMNEFAFGPTANRSVLGCLNEAMFALSLEFASPRFSSIPELEDYFSEYIYRATQYQPPRELAVQLLAARSVGAGVSVGGMH